MKNSFLFLVFATLIGGCVMNKKAMSNNPLQGTWELNYISGKRIAFEGLYPNKKPQLTFDSSKTEVRGNSSCNGFSSKYTVNGNSITFGDPLGTMMACEGSGEQDFYQMLKKVNKYSTDGTTLNFIIDDVAVMRFAKK